MTHKLRVAFVVIAGVLTLTRADRTHAQTPGPGIPALTYPSNQLFTVISRLNSGNGAPRGHGFVSMVNGYLFVIFANDSGGGNGSGGFAFFNLSNPYAPSNIFTTHNNPLYASTTGDYPGDIREPHAFSFSGNHCCIPTRRGLQIWDFTDVGPPANRPRRIAHIPALTGVSGGDYSPTPWWVCWQGGRYVYVAGTSTGLHIIDASNPTAPVYVNRGAGRPNPIPISQTGGFNVGTIFAIGNLLVITANDANGMATLDISDPANPVLLNVNGASPGYSAMVNGAKILGMNDPLSVHTIADNGVITFLRNAPDAGSKGGYGMFQDGFVFMGNSSNSSKIDIRNNAGYSVVGKVFPPVSNTDLDFGSAIGNLMFTGDDHGQVATAISPHQTAPDTTGPAVNWIIPRDGAVNQATTSRVGLTFTDQIDIRSVTGASFIVRPIGGAALTGRYSHQTGIVNFWPDAPLELNRTYEVILPAGGVKDFCGNGIAAEFRSLFSTGSQIVTFDVVCDITPRTPALVGDPVSFDVISCTGSDATGLSYSWNFGDGTPATPPSATSAASHAYAAGGQFEVTLTVSKGTAQRIFAASQTVTWPALNPRPVSSSSIVLDPATQRVWLTNPDANTVTAINAVTLTKLLEVPAGLHPQTLAVAPDATLWVAAGESTGIHILSAATGASIATIALPYGSKPHGLLIGSDAHAYVSLESRGEVLKIDTATRQVVGVAAVGRTPRALALAGTRLLVTRFISPVDRGEVVEVNTSNMSVVRTFSLAMDPGPDREDAGRGVPNYLLAAAITPDGRRAWIGSKKDNVQRGQFRDGLPLTFENTVRAIVSQLDLTTHAENLPARRDLNDRALPSAVAFTQAGTYAFVATLASNTVDILDAFSGQRITSLDDVGLAPQGLALSADFSRLFVHNFMSRDVAVYDVADVGAGNNIPLLARIDTVASELLSPQVLTGKQIFYDAADRRMSRDKYLSCAVCHLDGDSDERVWDFTDRGEGLRNTISLRAHGGMKNGPVHWSANFDEIQDFENDIRDEFAGMGFMTFEQFFQRQDPLGNPKAGINFELDAMAAYVASLRRAPDSPFRNPDGTMTADALAGEALFKSAATGCLQCHAGPRLTDSELRGNPFVLHNVGTLTAASGKRRGQTLTGIDTPTLKNLWETAPYLHDGSAATLMDVIVAKNPSNQHGATAQLTPQQRTQLVAYLLQIENFSGADVDIDGDVDQTDFAWVQRCLTSLTGPWIPGCDAADFNDDTRVDFSDIATFTTCARGPDIPADPTCAE